MTECKYNPSVGCDDPALCYQCGWNPEIARRRVRDQKEALAKKTEPVVTNYEKITASPGALADFLIFLVDEPPFLMERDGLLRWLNQAAQKG